MSKDNSGGPGYFQNLNEPTIILICIQTPSRQNRDSAPGPRYYLVLVPAVMRSLSELAPHWRL